MSEIVCPVCRTVCEDGATVCSVCGFADDMGINGIFINQEDFKDWFETVVKPYRREWEGKKREAELLAQLEAAKNSEKKLLGEVEQMKAAAKGGENAGFGQAGEEQAKLKKQLEELEVQQRGDRAEVKRLQEEMKERKKRFWNILGIVMGLIGGIIIGLGFAWLPQYVAWFPRSPIWVSGSYGFMFGCTIFLTIAIFEEERNRKRIFLSIMLGVIGWLIIGFGVISLTPWLMAQRGLDPVQPLFNIHFGALSLVSLIFYIYLYWESKRQANKESDK